MHSEPSTLRKRINAERELEVTSSPIDIAKKCLKRFDPIVKIEEDFEVRTPSGGTVSVVAWVLIVMLLISETLQYLKSETREHMVVDTILGEKLKININITFHNINCNEVHLDAMDVAGDNQLDIEHSLYKQRVSKEGKWIGDRFQDSVNTQIPVEDLPPNYCGSCYGADAVKITSSTGRVPGTDEQGDPCCNSCKEVTEAYAAMGWSVTSIRATAEQCTREASARTLLDISKDSGEGCNLQGQMEVNKVAGNFHVAIGEAVVRDGRHIHQFDPAEAHLFDISHTTHTLSFGQPYPGSQNPLDGTSFMIDKDTGTGLHQYFIQVVPTIYQVADSTLITNQFSFTRRFKPLHPKKSDKFDNHPFGMSSVLPGVFFIYDISPFMVEISQVKVPFTHFLTKICAIAGGVYSVAGVVDSLIHQGRMFSKGMLPA